MFKFMSNKLRVRAVAGAVAAMTTVAALAACGDSTEPRWNAYVLTAVNNKQIPFTDTLISNGTDTMAYLVHSASIRLRPAGVFESAFKVRQNLNTPNPGYVRLPTGGTYTRSNGQIAFYTSRSDTAAVMTGTISGDTMTLNSLVFGLNAVFVFR